MKNKYKILKKIIILNILKLIIILIKNKIKLNKEKEY